MEYCVCVVGGGHAGCEAALAAARLGVTVCLFAINLDSIAFMPCNPNIGGTSKGHLVRELDALGGEMGKNIDKTLIQVRMLNKSKGEAVHSLRAQADKHNYAKEMKFTLENTENLRIRQAEIVGICKKGETFEVTTNFGEVFFFKAVVVCAGTYLNSRCLYGETVINSGPNGFLPAARLTDSLRGFGVEFMRFKTGTPARIDRRTIDFSKMTPQYGDEGCLAFSFENDGVRLCAEQTPCYLTYTTEETARVIRENLHLAPMYSGLATGTGARYCPSIEDKIVRFADKPTHQVFIEPEGTRTNEMYVQGVSTSLPVRVQKIMYQTIVGLENCRITRPAYAIEYDCIDATALANTLGHKEVAGLFFAGQINGSSGYEEAAAQGLIAGINAAAFVLGKEPVVIDRSQGYIGVLIDDLVTKGTNEPYRMMTSRAEYRLLLRQDNADSRLTPVGYRRGLINSDRYQKFRDKMDSVARGVKWANALNVPATERLNSFLENLGTAGIKNAVKLAELLRRPELSVATLLPFLGEIPDYLENLTIQEQITIQIKYEGYIKRQIEQIERFKKLETRKIPKDFDYSRQKGIRIEARQKLSKIKPDNLGQASRISGVSPADVAVLMVLLKT
ncbi:tRNA uridine 5-carboxymethylaminomethyl modification enzyme MnmG [Clostridia bacterium]|nr:tRNA uridine 5-carboxymethylaminomethyl modification enzyme MnmG [Clostridia bacterium]